MIILEACFSPSLGGLELYCLNTARQLRDRGHRVHLWLAAESRMAAHPLARDTDPVISPAPGYVNPLFTWRLGRFVRERGIQAVHLHRSKDLSVFAPLKDLPKLLTLQIESALPKRDPFHRYVYSRVDRILTITQRMRGIALQALPADEAKIQALHYGLEPDRLRERAGDPAATRRRFGLPEAAFLVGLVGRLEENKGQEVLLRAFARIQGRRPDVHLLMAGEPPPENPGYDRYLERLAQDLGVAERTHFAGFQVDTAPLFAALDVSVLASREEAFGLVLLEAMAQGVPIVATRAGGVPEIVQDGVNGLLIGRDEAELAAALERLRDDPDLRRRLGQAGLRIVREKFRLEDHLRALEGHFEEIIEKRR
ncbi:MAG: glycosyltransferase family 1 protein [Candidatus Zixiibacteriota bacterium]|nr:MAG: glycosyltransferase family 1 protein [candidate division Zixibacteria bacterium]